MNQQRQESGSFTGESLDYRYLSFFIGTHACAIEIGQVREILGLQKWYALPETPAHIKGIINLRGQVLPLLEGRIRFGLENKEYDEKTSIVVVEEGVASFGIIVDEVSDVLEIPPGALNSPPRLGSDQAGYLKAIGRREEEMYWILAVDRLIQEDVNEGAAEHDMVQ